MTHQSPLYQIKPSSQFKKDYKSLSHQPQHKHLIEKVDESLQLLAMGHKLPKQFHDHKLKGKYQGYREYHIAPDVLLIYSIIEQDLILLLLRIGSHSELFG